MADAGLFVGWGTPVRGRELKSLDVFEEALSFYGQAQEAGEVESFEVVLLAPNGAELNGFILVRGSADQMAALYAREDFERINVRAALVVDRFHVERAALGEAMGDQIGRFRDAAGDVGAAAVA